MIKKSNFIKYKKLLMSKDHFKTDHLIDNLSFLTTNLYHSTENSSKRDNIFDKKRNLDKNATEFSANEQVINYCVIK